MAMYDAPKDWKPAGGSMYDAPGGVWQGGGRMTDPPAGWQPRQPNYQYPQQRQTTFLGRLFLKLFLFLLIFAGYLAVQIYSQPGKDFNAKLNNWYIKFEKNQPKEPQK